MSASLELAITHMAHQQEPLNPLSVMQQYIVLAGFEHTKGTPIVFEAIVAFEHAMDKYPTPMGSDILESDCSFYKRRVFARTIEDIRRAYWQVKLGHEIEDVERCTCPCCGKTTGYTTTPCPVKPETDTSKGEERIRRVKGRKRKGNKRRTVKRRQAAVLVDDDGAQDPYAPSTSACIL